MFRKTKTNSVGSKAYSSAKARLSRFSAWCQAKLSRSIQIASLRCDYLRFRLQDRRLPADYKPPQPWAMRAALVSSLSVSRNRFRAMSWAEKATVPAEERRRRQERWDKWTLEMAVRRFAKRLRSIGIADRPSGVSFEKDGYSFTWKDAEGARGKMYVSWHCKGCLNTYDSHEVRNIRDMGDYILDVRAYNCESNLRNKIMSIWTKPSPASRARSTSSRKNRTPRSATPSSPCSRHPPAAPRGRRRTAKHPTRGRWNCSPSSPTRQPGFSRLFLCPCEIPRGSARSCRKSRTRPRRRP